MSDGGDRYSAREVVAALANVHDDGQWLMTTGRDAAALLSLGPQTFMVSVVEVVEPEGEGDGQGPG